MQRVLIAGVSTRAAAESAARSGFDVTAIDSFGDLDQHASVRALSIPRPFSAHAAARAARRIESDAVAYLSNFENHPDAVRMLAAGRELWGNTPEVLRRVRDPMILVRALRRRGWAAPAVRAASQRSVNSPDQVRARLRSSSFPPSPQLPPSREALRRGLAEARSASFQRAQADVEVSPERFARRRTRLRWTVAESAKAEDERHDEGDVPDDRDRRWLLKPLASGGGHAVRPWHQDAAPPSGCYLQELITGAAHSVVFVAAAGRAVPLGVTRQVVGEGAFGATGYRYCGNILASDDDARLVDAACALARAIAEEFDLVGVNGIDFIARDACPYAVEVNPRWTAAMELVELLYGVPVFEAHAAACTSAALPAFDLAHARRCARAAGKAVVFAREDVTIGDTQAWIADGSVRDVPHPGELIRAGRPVCTVFGTGPDDAACYAALVRRAQRVYADLAAWKVERGR